MEFKNKKVLITGAGSGIGRSLAIRLAELGAEVFAVAKTQDHLDSLKSEQPSITTICQDLSKWNEVTRPNKETPGAYSTKPFSLLMSIFFCY